MKTIVWDIDDVLNDLMKLWFNIQWLKEHPDCSLKYEDLTENPPHKILGVSLEEYLLSLDRFRLSSLYQEMPPIKEVLEWFEKNGYKYRHIALTATPYKTVPYSAQWLFKNFGKWIRTFHFVPSERKDIILPQYDKDKSDFFKWSFKVDLFIDDNMDNLIKAQKVGVKVLAMPKPWNDNKDSIQDTLSRIEKLLER